MCSTTTRRVELQHPLRVITFYGTAAATDSLGAMFFEDLDGHDAKLEALLARARRQIPQPSEHRAAMRRSRNSKYRSM
jgi:truncated hemoglobin YjbI